MSTPGKVVLRRTWPQRIVIILCLGVIASALSAAWFTDDLYQSVASIGRVEISGEVLRTDTEPGEPVNFLLIGNDSALRLAADDPVTFGRTYDERGTFNADSITILRVDPASGQAWALAIPRDLLVTVPGTTTWRINAALLIDGPERLIETITTTFDIPINHYVELDFLAFQQVVDQLNGVPVWFDHPARDVKTGLNIPESGCYVMDGRQALAYVRSRNYQEFVDGEWVSDLTSDFGRIQRQQDFLVLALDRAIDRGARNPTTLASLIDAGAESVRLDTELTPSELIDLGEAFSEFNPENLARFNLQVESVWNEDNEYQGERMLPDVNDEAFAVFRGVSDLVRPSDVRFDLYAADESILENDGNLLAGTLGFDVARRDVLEEAPAQSVVVHAPGQRAAAETIARYLIPIPAVIEDRAASGTSVYLGTDHEQISWLFPHDAASTRAAIAEQGDVELPELGSTLALAPTTTAPSVDDEGAATTTTSVAAGGEGAPEPTTRIVGRPPEGQSCG